MNEELLDIQAGLKKGRGTRDQIANIRWIIEKQENFKQTPTSASCLLSEMVLGHDEHQVHLKSE